MKPEAHNPFYLLLLVASVALVMTALAYGLVPFEHQPAWLLVNGWKLLLVEVGAIILFGLLSMALDRFRSLQKPTKPRTMQLYDQGKFSGGSQSHGSTNRG